MEWGVQETAGTVVISKTPCLAVTLLVLMPARVMDTAQIPRGCVLAMMDGRYLELMCVV
jgi:hypothetical protein